MSGNSLYEELLRIHSMIRNDLARVSLLAESAAGGAAPVEVQEEIAELKSSTFLWQLRYGCLRHCRFVHSHHGLEDRALFPAVLRTDPALNETVERLMADHRQVSDLLDEVERAAAELEEPVSDQQRERLVRALESLGNTLLEHLDFEERSLEPALSGMQMWDL